MDYVDYKDDFGYLDTRIINIELELDEIDRRLKILEGN